MTNTKNALKYSLFNQCKIKKLLITIIFFALFLQINPAFAGTFLDVDSSYKYAQAIDFIADLSIVSGYPDGSYKPRNTLNRAELLKILIESRFEAVEFEKYSSNSCFQDVKNNQWFTKYVCFAKEKGFVEGYSDGNFRPSDEINLVEALKITLEVFQYNYEQTNPWYKGLIDSASENNFIPLDFTRFDQKMNRGQMADLITRILKYEEGVQEEYLLANSSLKVTYETLINNQNIVFDPLKSAKSQALPPEVKLNVPFSSQAPYGQWIPPYDEACEETSMIMVDYYLKGKNLTKEEAKTEILNLTSYIEQIGLAIDIGAQDVANITNDYLGRNARVYMDEEVTIDNIKKLLSQDYALIVPVSGQKLNNPNYSAPYHMLVVNGYNQEYFFTNDPGTRLGEAYKYPINTFLNAIHDWNGSKSNVLSGRKAMVVIGE